MSEWLLNGKEFTSEENGDNVAFVYLITNLKTGRMYVGKKLFHSPKYRMVNKKKKKYKAESDWKKYFGSSEELKKDVTELGVENFKREILHLCISKGNASYLEMREQMLREVLLDDMYYNAFIGGKIHGKHLKGLKKSG